jgi:hypothetical protein
MCLKTFSFRVIAEKFIYKTSSTRLNPLLYTSYGPSRQSKDAGMRANSLTGIHNAMVKCLYIVSRSCMAKGFMCPHV